MTALLPGDLALLHRLADLASAQTLPRFRTDLAADDKHGGPSPADYDPVTAADREAERAVRAHLSRERPDDGVFGEELPETSGTSGRRWVIDPVDGTRSFVCGVPVWTSLIALERDGLPVLGVIEQPVSGERWWTSEDRTARFRDRRGERLARTSTCEALASARLMVTDLRAGPGAYLGPEQARRIADLAVRCRLLRQGLDSYAFGLLASGHMDLVVEAGLGWHDVAGVLPVIAAAGGQATDWRGEPLRQGWDGTLVAAATPALAGEALALLS